MVVGWLVGVRGSWLVVHTHPPHPHPPPPPPPPPPTTHHPPPTTHYPPSSPSADLQVAGREGHWTKRGGAEPAGVDADGAVELKRHRPSDSQTAEYPAQARHVRKADREVERHGRL